MLHEAAPTCPPRPPSRRSLLHRRHRHTLPPDVIFLCSLLAALAAVPSLAPTAAAYRQSPLYQYPGLVTGQYSTGAAAALRSHGSANGTATGPSYDDADYDNGAAGVYATGLILCLIGIYYDVWIIFHESRNSASSGSSSPRYSRSTRRAALQYLLRIKPYSETTTHLTKKPPDGASTDGTDSAGGERQRIVGGGGGGLSSYTTYGSVSTGSLTTLLAEEEYPFPCAICLDDCRGTQLVVSTDRCPHIFHRDCILEWLEKHETCPCCRVPMVTKEEIVRVVQEKKVRREPLAV
mmetsp:Transcript_5404/g.11356  ORF Transcript_5404/g.11356 Transcript_5404/m.11356 type:complete len:293 (-) Transcript_5404:137-1015(-)